ncbi:MAG: SulP family inorganic anion transporter [Pseudomonadota bacterium]
MPLLLRNMKLPLFGGILPLHLRQIPGEIIAGMTLAALAIPEVMGYTRIAGTPLITGLYTMLIPAALFAVFCSSRHLVVGADSATAAILASGLVGMAAVGSDHYLALAMALAVMVGLILLLASVLGLGFMADFLSRPVLVGFLSGVGIQVVVHALHDLIDGNGTKETALAAIMALPQALASANLAECGIAAATVVSLMLGKLVSTRWHMRLPMAMLVVIVAIVLSWSYDWQRFVAIVGPIPTGLPKIALPEVTPTLPLIWSLLPTAFAMAVVVLAQSAATARAYASERGETLDVSRDLFALGLANIGSGISGTFTVNGSPTKTAMMRSAGGNSQLALLAMVGIVILTLLFLTGPLSYLPQAVLSGVVLLIGLDLIDLKSLRDIYRKRPVEFRIALATVVAVLLFGVEKGIGFAVLLSVIAHTRHGYRPRDLLLTEDAAGDVQGSPLSASEQLRPGLMVYRFAHAMYFANAHQMRDEITSLVAAPTPPLRWFCIDVSAVDDIDYTAQAMLEEIAERLHAKSIRLMFVQNLSETGPLSHQKICDQFGEGAFFASLKELLQEYKQPSGAGAEGQS